MIIELASKEAIAYACQHFHYAKRCTFSFVGYNVYNEDSEWCGVVCFDRGNIHAATPFGLVPGQVAELVRVALNGKQEQTSKAVMAAVRQFARDAPLVQILISYADLEEGHVGTIYQATNWSYLGQIHGRMKWWHPGRQAFVHSREVTPTGQKREYRRNTTCTCHKQSDLVGTKSKSKLKYAYALRPVMRAVLNTIQLPYLKRANV